jgi:hypothetical protein
MKRIPIVLVIILTTVANFKTAGQDPAWVRDNTWFFDNFTKDTLSWNLFRETFIGVAPAPSADFDQFFYSALYQTRLASPGLCYGMDVMAMLIMKNGGHLGFCHPPYVYSGVDRPDDPNLETAIEITHGNQINHGFLSFMLDVIAAGKLRDGNYAFDKVVEYLSKNDPPVICISASSGGLTGDSGHVIVPYAVQQTGSIKKIYVYDPNRSYYVNATDGRAFYDAGLNFIQVDANTGSWTYNMAGALGNWFGDPNSGGRMVAVPLSVVGKKDRLPQSLLAEGAIAINTILIYGDVKVEQITDHLNKRKLISDNGKDVETNESRRLKNVLPFISFGNTGTGSGNGNAYFVRGLDQLDLQLRACGYYKIGFMFNGNYKYITGIGEGSVQHVFTPYTVVKSKLKKRKPVYRNVNIGRSTITGSNKLL